MITRDRFDLIKSKYAYCASWAVWADAGESPKSNVGDLSVLDPDQNPDLLDQLNPNFVLIGLNISRGDIVEPLANFHDKRPQATDYKIRFALQGSPFWGAYMTDIIKDFEEKVSGKMMSYLREHPSFEQENIQSFRQELVDVGGEKPALIALGNDTFDILKRNLGDEFLVRKIPHYANYTSKEKYREQVKAIW